MSKALLGYAIPAHVVQYVDYHCTCITCILVVFMHCACCVYMLCCCIYVLCLFRLCVMLVKFARDICCVYVEQTWNPMLLHLPFLSHVLYFSTEACAISVFIYQAQTSVCVKVLTM